MAGRPGGGWPRWQVTLTFVLVGLLRHGSASSQDLDEALLAPQPGEDATREELRAFRSFQMRKYVRARELASKVVEADPKSVVGHFVLGLVHRYGEANFPKALYHTERALRLFDAQHGPSAKDNEPWAWRMRLLQEMAFIHGDLEHHREKLHYLSRYNEAYDPDLEAEQAWPLMKLGEFETAKAVATRALNEAPSSPDGGRQTLVALNALCAIDFEAGHDGESYVACRRALEHGKDRPEGASVVDYTNFAEAARSLFRLEEAERVSLEATKASASWYGNPWLELSELYTREGRFAESLTALREMNAYIKKRPPHARNADLHERWRAIASFLLVAGRAEKALEITEKAVQAPDRSAFRSRDAAQDRAVMALLHRRALLSGVFRLREEMAVRSWFEEPFQQLYRWGASVALRLRAWSAAKEVAKNLAETDRLVGSFRIGTAASGIMPPWLAPELVDVLGGGVVESAIEKARDGDGREGADAYYDAFLAEVRLSKGDAEVSAGLAQSALSSLGTAEALLRARLLSVRALAASRNGATRQVRGRRYEAALQLDPGVFRRRGRPVPVSFVGDRSVLSNRALTRLRRSPSFREGDSGLRVQAEVSPVSGRLCMEGLAGSVLACHEEAPHPDESPEVFLVRLLDGFHKAAFAPRIDLSQGDIHSLDGSNRVGRDLLEDVTGD